MTDIDVNVKEKIKSLLHSAKIVLFMKGSPEFPQCGFSSRVCQILKACQADFMAYDILQDAELREGLKRYSDWPTYPQLYIDGELVGGCDIVTELYETKALQPLLATV